MPKFFKKTPKSGNPICLKGFAKGLADIARALEGISIEGGYTEWSGGIPTLVPGSMEQEAAAGETCYVLRKATAADVAAAPTLVEGQWLISKRTFAVGSEESYEATVPHTCPVVTT